MPDDRSNGGVTAATVTKPPPSPAGGVGALKKGPWTAAEDGILVEYVRRHGEGNWNAVQRNTGLKRCGKSCRLRWANHLRPNLKKGPFSPEEERLILDLHSKLGNKWARMAAQLPGRTDNEIKNYWNTRIKRRQRAGLPLYPQNPHRPSPPLSLFHSFTSPLQHSQTPPNLTKLQTNFNPHQSHTSDFLFNALANTDYNQGERFCFKTELPSNQFLSPDGRSESLMLDSLMLESGYVGGERRGLGFLQEVSNENGAFVNGNACEVSEGLGFKGQNDPDNREDREEYGAVDDDMSALLELIPMAASRGWCDGNGSSSEGGKEISNGQSSGLTEDNIGMQALPTGAEEDEGRSIGYLQWMGETCQ